MKIETTAGRRIITRDTEIGENLLFFFYKTGHTQTFSTGNFSRGVPTCCHSIYAIPIQKIAKGTTHALTTLADLHTRGGNRLHSQLPSECDYLLRVLEFMAIILL